MFKSILKYLDGKKTFIGFVLVTASSLVPEPTIKTILQVVGTMIGGTGAMHKVRKGELKTKK